MSENDTEGVRELWRSARQHDRGMICPAAMWGEVLRVVDVADPARVFGLASDECRVALRRIYHDRPWSLRNEGRDDESLRLVEAVEAWCRAAAA